MESPSSKLERMAATSSAAREIMEIAKGNIPNPIESLRGMTGQSIQEVNTVDSEMMQLTNEAEAKAIADEGFARYASGVQYDLMHKLFESLNALKGFEVSMNGPREGKLFVNFKGVDFTLEVSPTVSESLQALKDQFK